MDRTLAHYEVLDQLGAGGMGAVYRARDTRLGRDVALKVLSEGSFTDDNARARLVREAQLASSLNHPHIGTIYEVGEAGGHTYIAMEMVKGRPLSEEIGGSELPVETVLRYGVQLADALSHAHGHGVVHRDLKSSNIMIASDGRSKVLDFGVAARIRSAPDDATMDQERLTEPGVVVGTPPYLAPEVLRGDEADERSDIWSLGVVLYEMATGALPFTGRTAHELSAAILREPTPPMPAFVPAGLRAVIRHCLEKDPALRFHRASEVRAALEALQGQLREPAQEPAAGSFGAPRHRRSWMRLTLALAALGVILAAARFAWRQPWRSPELEQRQLTSDPETEYGALSPDGKTLVVAVSRTALALRSIDSGESHAVALPEGFSLEGSIMPMINWFPDGSRLLVSGTMVDGTTCTWAIPVLGGTARRVLNGGNLATVSPDGARIAYLRRAEAGPEIWCAGPNGDDPRRVVSSDSTGTITTWAVWSPRGERLAYARSTAGPDGWKVRLESSDLQGRCRVIFAPTGAQELHPFALPAWLPDGRMIFGLTDPPPNQADFNLWSLRVDPRTGEPSGRPTRITQWPGLSLVAPTGSSSDGKRLSVQQLVYQSDCYVGTIAAGDSVLREVKRLTRDDRMDVSPVWTPDGRTILFASDRNGTVDLFRQRLDARDAEVLVTGPGVQQALAISPDGAWILYADVQPSGDGAPSATARLMRMPVTGGPSEKVFDMQPAAGLCCALPPHSLCVLSEIADGEIVFTAVDPLHGRGRELARMKGGEPPIWDLSPDGATIAVGVQPGDSVPRIHLIPLDGTAPRDVPIDREVHIASLAWSADGRGWFMVSLDKRWDLLRVDATGKTTALIPSQMWMYSASVSPDGHGVAYTSNTGRNSFWLLENF